MGAGAVARESPIATCPPLSAVQTPTRTRIPDGPPRPATGPPGRGRRRPVLRLGRRRKRRRLPPVRVDRRLARASICLPGGVVVLPSAARSAEDVLPPTMVLLPLEVGEELYEDEVSHDGLSRSRNNRTRNSSSSTTKIQKRKICATTVSGDAVAAPPMHRRRPLQKARMRPPRPRHQRNSSQQVINNDNRKGNRKGSPRNSADDVDETAMLPLPSTGTMQLPRHHRRRRPAILPMLRHAGVIIIIMMKRRRRKKTPWTNPRRGVWRYLDCTNQHHNNNAKGDRGRRGWSTRSWRRA